MLKRRKALAISVVPRITMLRGHKVILDTDLAVLYGVPVKRLNQQVRRNLERFPQDFMFQVPVTDRDSLRLQIATSKTGRGGRRYLPYAFTEHGAIMAATVLKSKRAIEMSVFVVRAFVRLREVLASNRQVAFKIEELGERLETHDAVLQEIIRAITALMQPAKKSRRQDGVSPSSDEENGIDLREAIKIAHQPPSRVLLSSLPELSRTPACAQPSIT